MKAYALFVVIAAALAWAAAAGAATKRDPTLRQAFRAIQHCAEQAGAASVRKMPGGGEMTFSPSTQTGVVGIAQQMFAAQLPHGTLDWGYALGRHGRVTGLMVVTSGDVPWHSVGKCLERRFGPASAIF